MSDTPDERPTFTLGDTDHPHRVGDPECGEGWCGGNAGYPRSHGDGCPGLLHAEFGDENTDGDYWLYTRCDVCGESE